MLSAFFHHSSKPALLLALACGELDRSLGERAYDLDEDSGVGSANGTGGSGAFSGNAGATGGYAGGGARGGHGGAAGGYAGGGATGGHVGASTGGNAGMGSTGGSAGSTSSGGNAGAGPTGECFSPANHPELALTGGRGCRCSEGDSAACIVLDPQPDSGRFTMACHQGRWAVPVDGCGMDQRPFDPGSCKIGFAVYSSGSRGVPDPISCNKCVCIEGKLGCTERYCPIPCPSGTGYGAQCAQCGPADDCEVVEHGCLPTCEEDNECARPAYCIDGVCRTICV